MFLLILMDNPVNKTRKYQQLILYNSCKGKVVPEGCMSLPVGNYNNNPGVNSRNLLE